MQNRRTKQEQRVLAHYALQEGGKALEEGLMQNSKLQCKTPYLLLIKRFVSQRRTGSS